jgi:hypothetical protein
MGIVHERPGWWIEPDDHAAPPGAATTPPVSPDESTVVEVTAQIRPMGRWSTFTTRPRAYACLNCGEWIHPGRGAWYDPDLDESVCSSCWPETVTTPSPR